MTLSSSFRVLLTADPELPVPPRYYGGIERIVDLLAAELQAGGHTVGLVAHHESACAVSRLFPWPGFQSQKLSDSVRNMAALASAVRQFKPDVIHSFSRLLYLLPVLPRAIPKVMCYQRPPTRRTVHWAARLANDSLVFAGISEHISRLGSLGGGLWHTVYNAVDMRKYTFQPSVPADAPLVFLSRVERIKGAHTAIAAARRAGRRLVIAGNHGDWGAEKTYWETEILPHLGHDGIEYVGTVDDAQKNALLGRAAAMLVPIEWDEPFGIVFAEALACGTPVISCPRGALPEIVREGVDGFLVRDAEGAAAAIGRLSTIDRRACRGRAEDCFSSATMTRRYLEVYQEAMKGGPHANG